MSASERAPAASRARLQIFRPRYAVLVGRRSLPLPFFRFAAGAALSPLPVVWLSLLAGT
jgi:hypothetical protein